jgi:cyclopropane-fatty-acyl-phospholipid synthase
MSQVEEQTLTSTSYSLPRTRSGWLEGWIRDRIAGHLDTLKGGRLTVVDGDRVQTWGEPGDLFAALTVRNSRFYRDVFFGGSLAFAEGYLRGDWDCDDVTALLRLMIRNQTAPRWLDRGWARLSQALSAVGHWWKSNTRRGSRDNIAAHYDLGNEFYRLWLDETLSYSCAVFPTADSTLFEGSTEKIDRVCRKLQLSPSDHLLEIGTGWGGLALHAATHYGCRVTTTTISVEQLRIARERIAAAGLCDRVTVLETDYRDLTGTYDKLVSIEMIEAVGHEHLDGYFAQCSRLLKPGGSFLLQGIVLADQLHARYLQSVDFIQKHVFPGGCLPSVQSLMTSMTRASQLRLVHLEDFAPHYARTLREWRSRFEARSDEVRDQGFDTRFLRLWHYYLCYCEAAFEERQTGLVQMLFDQPGATRDPLQITTAAAGN